MQWARLFRSRMKMDWASDNPAIAWARLSALRLDRGQDNEETRATVLEGFTLATNEALAGEMLALVEIAILPRIQRESPKTLHHHAAVPLSARPGDHRLDHVEAGLSAPEALECHPTVQRRFGRERLISELGGHALQRAMMCSACSQAPRL